MAAAVNPVRWLARLARRLRPGRHAPQHARASHARHAGPARGWYGSMVLEEEQKFRADHEDGLLAGCLAHVPGALPEEGSAVTRDDWPRGSRGSPASGAEQAAHPGPLVQGGVPGLQAPGVTAAPAARSGGIPGPGLEGGAGSPSQPVTTATCSPPGKAHGSFIPRSRAKVDSFPPASYPISGMPCRCEDCGAWRSEYNGRPVEPHRSGCIYQEEGT
jgi:hypothetical protein